MSTNYYLHRSGDACASCGHERKQKVIHIGLSAIGWVFLWRGWKTAEESPFGKPVTSPAEWREILRAETANGAIIMAEYDVPCELDDFLAFAERKRFWQGGKGRVRSGASDYRHVDGDDIAFREFG